MTDQLTDAPPLNTNNILLAVSKLLPLLGADCKKNIKIILEQSCAILEASCSIYNGLDNKGEELILQASHSLPDDFKKNFILHCHETILKTKDKAVAFGNLDETDLAYLKEYDFKSYIGFPVTRKDKITGTLCILDTKNRKFNDDEIVCIQMLAAAIALEEERILSEKERLIEKERYRLLVENANDAIFIIQDGVIKFANPKTLAMSGYTLEELSKMPFEELIHPDEREQIKNNHIKRIKGEDILSSYSFKAINKHKKTVHIQINAAPILWDNKIAILYCTRNLTRLKKLESKLKRAEKMELIGTLAGGVAHDLNNILSGLVSYPEMLLLQLDKDDPFKETIQFIHESGLKAAEIVQDLLTLARRGVNVGSVVSLNSIIQDYFNTPSHKRLASYYPSIEFTTKLDSDLLNLNGSPLHLSKIIMNLMINAAEAVFENGQVSIETYNQYIDSPLDGYDSVREGDYVVLKIEDNGSGIDVEDLRQIFDPFYTNKKMGRSGSGLGLSVVWNSMKDHQGYIVVNSQKGAGTVFELYFPATHQLAVEEAASFDVKKHKGNKEAVLVIDDMEGQRKIAAECLELLNYTPYTASSGEQALKFLKKHPMDMLLLDMKMEPGIDGLETYRQALEINPEQKAIIASGFSENKRVKEALRIGAGEYIKKPYTIKKLAYTLKKHLH